MDMLHQFKFCITAIKNTSPDINEKTVSINTVWNHPSGQKISGLVRVRSNDFGIFPVAEDIARFVPQPSLRKALSAQIIKYIRPQKRFL
ncbi:hypothetical protein D1970_08140 [Mesobacillus zeae]|uniref:Uncharacterized protein n=1 Tax=Mesobacillus zeae TaxID=1917180 RepID=A0A398B7S1_9BACI|nr:hypothetical protein D1970_08140 [Mesobacillus zeae]